MAEKIVAGHGSEQSTEYISRDEFDLYDTFKTLSLISFFFSMCLAKIAMKGRMGSFYSPRWSGPNNTRRQMKKFGCSIVFLLMICGVAHYYMQSIKPIMDKYDDHHQQEKQPEQTNIEHNGD